MIRFDLDLQTFGGDTIVTIRTAMRSLEIVVRERNIFPLVS